MSLFKIGLCGVLLLCFALVSLLQAEETVQETGKRLVTELFSDLQAGNIDAVEQRMSPAFQSAHKDGARDRAEQVVLMRTLELGPFGIDDVRATKKGHVMVVTYTVSAAESFNDERFEKMPAQRLSVFHLTREGWRWIAHANLHPMQ